MRVQLRRPDGKGGSLALSVVAETDADRAALRDFAAPLAGRDYAEGAATVIVSHAGPDFPAFDVEAIGPGAVQFQIPAVAKG